MEDADSLLPREFKRHLDLDIDNIYRRILRLLQADGRISNLKLA